VFETPPAAVPLSLRASACAIAFAAFAGTAAAQDSRTPAKPAPAAMSAAPVAPAPSRVCFSVTMQCFAARSQPSSTVTSGLDLRAPAITSIVPQSELQAPLTDPDEPKYDEPLVKVEGERGVPVNVPVGIMSLPWAVRHPSQAWRIFLPSPSRMKDDED
jgi:hypothetical protein